MCVVLWYHKSGMSMFSSSSINNRVFATVADSRQHPIAYNFNYCSNWISRLMGLRVIMVVLTWEPNVVVALSEEKVTIGISWPVQVLQTKYMTSTSLVSSTVRAAGLMT